MNVIVSNKYQSLLANLNIDVIKNINGVFSVDDLAIQFKNFFYNKMILDITALENYEDVYTIQKLSVAFDMNKVILLLDDSPRVNSAEYLSQLVSMGIYNFTKNIDSIAFLMDNPNTYKDVASFHNLSFNQNNGNNNMMSNNNNFGNNNQSSGGFSLFGGNQNNMNNQSGAAPGGMLSQKIIGIRNITDHAGATTLTYLLKKHIENSYRVKAVEVDKRDFAFFNDNSLDSVSSMELPSYISRNSDAEVILIDMGTKDELQYCNDSIYLIEPGLIPLNRLIRTDYKIFESLKGKKIILNRSVLSGNDISDFERESGSKVFFNLPNIDDKSDNIKEVKELLAALGLTRIDTEGHKGFSLFGM